MRIRLIRDGGLLGRSHEADVDTLGRPDGTELERLAHEVLTEQDARPRAGPGVPDAYHYRLTVDDRPPVEFTDPGLTEGQLRLVERVLGEGS
ncbi:protealysin inhibitor emfourin [Streptomyces sp. NPDC047000]|uniref:protealysin inhibitor emfourin n=1 Tax=Streptomyces sp. NPDC047000 TaxID=3155474 RepID=UPI0033C843B1